MASFHPPSKFFLAVPPAFKNFFPGPIGSSYTPAMVSTWVWSLLPTDHSALGLAGFRPLKLNVEKPLSVFVKYRERDRKSTRLNSSHGYISYAVFCLKK